MPMLERNAKLWPMPSDVVQMRNMGPSDGPWWSVKTVTYRSAVDGKVTLTKPGPSPDHQPFEADVSLEEYRDRVDRVMDRW